MKPNLVCINSEQFGYHTDTYYYCKYLKDKYEISYICWDHGLKKITMPGVHVEYVDRTGGIARVVRLVKCILNSISSRNTIIFIKYFKMVSTLVHLLQPCNPIVLDIRTGSIEPNPGRRFVEDLFLKVESSLFKNITVISESLARKLGLEKKASILPLGADIISSTNKKFDHLSLLYVGTLYNRKIENAIIGFAEFHKKYKGDCPLKFTIIGAGVRDEIANLKAIAIQHGINDLVHILGRVPHDQLEVYFDTHNIGVSYIPITSYYDVQPATKTFEYLLSGMPVLATATSENRLVINPSNGVLVADTSDAYCHGLIDISNRLKLYDSAQIRRESDRYSWKIIVDNLVEYLHKVSY